ncbi:MAG: class I SAM-dependent methyltransferase [Candidatus Zhuqueibacterota bacterium]
MTDTIVFQSGEKILADNLREIKSLKSIQQNIFYTAEGAESFYQYRGPGIIQINWRDEVQFFEKLKVLRADSSTAFVSLGCGNGAPEKMLLQHLSRQGYRIDYFGVDSSEAMLKLASASLADVRYNRRFFLADFTHSTFKDALTPYLQHYDTILYAFMGGTFGNFEQTHIAGVMRALVGTHDYFYLDIVPTGHTPEMNNALKKRYADLPKNYRNFFARLLEKFALSEEHGHIISQEEEDLLLNALTCTFYFVPNLDKQISVLDEWVTITPNDRIKLMSIRAYHIPSLKEFLKSYNFNCIDDYIPNADRAPHLWQRLLFQKK